MVWEVAVKREQFGELLCRMVCEVRLSYRLSLSLLALGLKHFEGTEFPKPLISKYLVTCKTAHQLTVRIKNLNLNRAPNNVIKVSECENSLPPFSLSVNEGRDGTPRESQFKGQSLPLCEVSSALSLLRH